MNKKIRFRNGFTLPEVLITLGLIGVIAAITLPILINKHQNATTLAQIKVAYAKINDGFLLVCSDGLYNSLSDEQMMNILHAQEDIETRASQLMDAANTYGGQDNISFALIITKGVVDL